MRVVRDRVIVAVEAHVGLLARRDRPDVVALEAVRRQRQQPCALVDESVAHRAARQIAGHRPGVRDPIGPVGELAIEVLDGGEPPRREEAVAQVLDRALDLALLVTAVRGARHRREVVVAGALEDLRVKRMCSPTRSTTTLFKLSYRMRRRPRRGFRTRGMAEQERLECLVERAPREHRTRPRKHEDEARQRARRGADLDLAEVVPVDLGLLAGQGRQLEERLGMGGRPHRADVSAHRRVSAHVPARTDHLENARRAQLGVPIEDLADERLERIEQRRPELALGAHEAVALDGARRCHGAPPARSRWCRPSSARRRTAAGCGRTARRRSSRHPRDHQLRELGHVTQAQAIAPASSPAGNEPDVVERRALPEQQRIDPGTRVEQGRLGVRT